VCSRTQAAGQQCISEIHRKGEIVVPLLLHMDVSKFGMLFMGIGSLSGEVDDQYPAVKKN